MFRSLSLCVFVGFLAGCGGESYEIVEVRGTVTKGNQLLEEVRVDFLPDPEKGTQGPMSSAETSAEGSFQLELYGDVPKPGVVVGWHRVTVQDFKALNSRDNPIPPRFGTELGFAGSTPITVEISKDTKSVVIDLDKLTAVTSAN